MVAIRTTLAKRTKMKPITNLICLKTLYIYSLFASCFFIGSPAWAQESEPQTLDRAYCDSIELGHPDLERCDAFLEELVAEEELALEESMYMEAQAEEALQMQMVAESRLIAAERRDEAPERSENSRTETQTRSNAGSVIITGAGTAAGVFGGFIGGVIITFDYGVASGADGLVWAFTTVAGGIVGGLIGRGISNNIWGDDEDDNTRAAQFYVAPYLNEDASGLTFSSRF
jgi:hypothetical protein